MPEGNGRTQALFTELCQFSLPYTQLGHVFVQFIEFATAMSINARGIDGQTLEVAADKRREFAPVEPGSAVAVLCLLSRCPTTKLEDDTCWSYPLDPEIRVTPLDTDETQGTESSQEFQSHRRGSKRTRLD